VPHTSSKDPNSTYPTVGENTNGWSRRKQIALGTARKALGKSGLPFPLWSRGRTVRRNINVRDTSKIGHGIRRLDTEVPVVNLELDARRAK
jgi:hypothetical protein